MKKTKKEGQPASAKRNVEGSTKSRSDKSSQASQPVGKKGAELFKNGTLPKDDENRDITGPDDYRLRANRREAREDRSQGNKSKDGQQAADRNKADSVKAEMQNRSRGNSAQGKSNTGNGKEK